MSPENSVDVSLTEPAIQLDVRTHLPGSSCGLREKWLLRQEFMRIRIRVAAFYWWQFPQTGKPACIAGPLTLISSDRGSD